MMADSLKQAESGGAAAKSFRIPSLPGKRQQETSTVDTGSAAYQAGFDAASKELLAQLQEQEKWHENFAHRMGDMLADMDARYRRECMVLIERLFAASAPTLARLSSVADLMQLIDERVMGEHADLTLRAHPTLIAHLPEKAERTLSAAPKVTLVQDETCPPNMIDAKWKNGGLFHDPDGLIEKVMRALREENAQAEETTDE